jgi:FtsH-binding integral membrane protein
MIKPYQITKENRYLGLPLGFGFLGATYALSAFAYFQPYFFGNGTIYLQVVVRTFAFVFLCVTYYFSRKSAENNQWLWNATLILLISVFVTSVILLSIPQVNLPSYQLTSTITRVFNLICIVYLCAHTLRSHLETLDPDTLWSPFGYILLGISQYSLIIYANDNSMSAWWGALVIRWAGLAIFLIIAYKAFYNTKKNALIFPKNNGFNEEITHRDKLKIW